MRLGYDELQERDYQSAPMNSRQALTEHSDDDSVTQAVANVRIYLKR